MHRHIFALAAVAAFVSVIPSRAEDGEPSTAKQAAETLRGKLFPKSKLVEVPDMKQAYYQPTWMLSFPDGGARAKRLKPKTRETPEDTFRRFFDAVSSLNIENRLYVTEFASEDLAAGFAKERDGTTALDPSVNLAAIVRGSLVLWGDKRLVEKAKAHW